MTYNWFRDKSGKIYADDKSASYAFPLWGLEKPQQEAHIRCASLVLTKRGVHMNTKAIAALELLLEALKSEGSEAHAAAPQGNRTPAHTDYQGGNPLQDVVDVARRFVRYSRIGVLASKKERKVARNVIKAVKAGGGIWNTNGVDVFTLNGL